MFFSLFFLPKKSWDGLEVLDLQALPVQFIVILPAVGDVSRNPETKCMTTVTCDVRTLDLAEWCDSHPIQSSTLAIYPAVMGIRGLFIQSTSVPDNKGFISKSI